MANESMDVQRFYDDLIFGDKATLEKSEAMLKAFPVPTLDELPKLDVLEVGLGRGEWTLGLATHAHGYAGLDYSSRTLEYVRQELAAHGLQEKASLTHGTVLALPFADDSFDAVYCIGVLHHTADAAQGFRELLRVLKPGGTINVMLYGKVQPRNIIRDTLFHVSRLGRWAESLVLRFALAIEKLHLPDAWFFNADGNVVLYRDWYFAPRQSHHTVRQVSQWARQGGAEVTYVFLDPYRNSMKRHQRWASGKVSGRLLCPDFMASIGKQGAAA